MIDPLDRGEQTRITRVLVRSARLGAGPLVATVVGMLRGQAQAVEHLLDAGEVDEARHGLRRMVTTLMVVEEADRSLGVPDLGGVAADMYRAALSPLAALTVSAADRWDGGDLVEARAFLAEIGLVGKRVDVIAHRALTVALDGLPADD